MALCTRPQSLWQQRGGKGSLTIRPLKAPPTPPADHKEQAWSVLRDALSSALAGDRRCSASEEEAYTLVEALCASGSSEWLASHVQQQCESHLRQRMACLQPQVASAAAAAEEALQAPAASQEAFAEVGLGLLVELHRVWEDHQRAMQAIGAVFMHLDRVHVLPQHDSSSSSSPPSSLWDESVQLFRGLLSAVPRLPEQASWWLLWLIDSERRGLRPAAGLGAEPLLCMFAKLGIYKPLLEPLLLGRAAEYYRRESVALLQELPIAAYLVHCERRLEEERRRCEGAHADCGSSIPELLRCVREELLGCHKAEILEASLDGFLRGHRLDDLARLYRSFAGVDGLPALRRAWGQRIRAAGREILAACGDDLEESRGIVPALIDLRARLLEILAESFQGSSDFALALKDGLEEVLAADPQNLPAKLLARHIDEMLRNERACGGAADLEESVQRVMGLFRLVAAKDAFEAFYRKDLARRLLSSRACVSDAESLVIQKLQEECGSSYTSKLEGMFRDVEISRGFFTAFAARADVQAAQEEGGVELSVSVLTSSLWPTQPQAPELLYPVGPARLQDLFASFYAAQHAGRSLRWAPQLGHCTLRATFAQGKKELAVSHFQALALLLFNGADSLTTLEVAAATQIGLPELRRTLQSLALHKTIKPLSKEPKGREVADSDVFSFNAAFGHKLYRIAVPQISAKELQEEEAVVEQRVLEDRQHEVDAAVVRIMKSKRTVTHQQLLTEVFSTVSFTVQAADVKKRIESLIEREYLERDADAPATYNYLA